MDRVLWPLFSKPLYKGDIDVTGVDLSHIEWQPNNSNWLSTDLKVLESMELRKINAQVLALLNEYFYGVMEVNPEVEIYITESWLNKTETGQMHHRHWHPNSVLSGIVYLQTDGDSGRTRFVDSRYDTLEFAMKQANIYNSKSWTIAPEAGKVVIFPSSVEHMVDKYEGTEPRITLAFNTFVKGGINSSPLTELRI